MVPKVLYTSHNSLEGGNERLIIITVCDSLALFAILLVREFQMDLGAGLELSVGNGGSIKSPVRGLEGDVH